MTNYGELEEYTNLNPSTLETLQTQFTSLDSQVYFATSDADPTMIATAMARLSRSSKDLRRILAEEFLDNPERAGAVAERIIFDYGDDSVAQLASMQAVVENGSNLLTKILEWGRLGSYLEQSTRYLRFDERDENGRYPFHTPEDLLAPDRAHYEAEMEKIFDAYSEAVARIYDFLNRYMEKDPELSPAAWKSTLQGQACDAARVLLPVAVQTTVGIVGSPQAFENMIMRMQSMSLPEARKVGEQMLYHARIVAPQYFRRVDLPDRGNLTSAHLQATRQRMTEWAEEHDLRSPDISRGEKIRLVDFTPPDELEIVKYVLFEASGRSIEEIEKYLSNIPEQEQRTMLKEYIGERYNRRHKPGRAFEHPHYTWELVTDYGIFRDLQRHRMVDDLRWQVLGTTHGHVDIGELAEQAGVAGQFSRAYQLSEELTAYLAERYGTETAQYSTLLGHLMRWTFTENAREAYHLHELRTMSQGHPGYRRVVNEMHKELAIVHPVIAEGMIFVDTSESPKLTRLQEAIRAARKARQTGLQ